MIRLLGIQIENTRKNISYKVEKSLTFSIIPYDYILSITYSYVISSLYLVNGSTFSNFLFVDEQTIAVLGLHSSMRWFCTRLEIKSCSWKLNCGEWKGQLAIVWNDQYFWNAIGKQAALSVLPSPSHWSYQEAAYNVKYLFPCIMWLYMEIALHHYKDSTHSFITLA